MHEIKLNCSGQKWQKKNRKFRSLFLKSTIEIREGLSGVISEKLAAGLN